MSSKFDAYEIIGVITPGSILLFGLALVFPDLEALFFAEGFSLGDLGLFLVLSFVAGHLIQAVGNLVEVVVWKPFGGMPTDWLATKPERLIHTGQIEHLRQALKSNFECDLTGIKHGQFVPIVRAMYAAVQEVGKTERIDSFNRTYGLMRGVTAAFIVLALVTLVVMWPSWKPSVLIAITALVAGYRMVRFGIRYGRELVVAYLQVAASRGG